VVVPKLPDRPDLALLAASTPEHYDLGTDEVLWRIHRTTGPHVAPFNNLRTFGPIRSCRFDPHPDGPATEHQGIGVLYAAGTLQTSLAEVFQITRVIDCVTDAPAASAFRLRRTVKLLDLTGEWPVRSGASHVINTGRRSAAYLVDDRRLLHHLAQPGRRCAARPAGPLVSADRARLPRLDVRRRRHHRIRHRPIARPNFPSEPPRACRRLHLLGRMGSCRGDQGATRRSCGNVPCGWLKRYRWLLDTNVNAPLVELLSEFIGRV
jgi:hypothetical protein